jgi:hypothetical protein
MEDKVELVIEASVMVVDAWGRGGSQAQVGGEERKWLAEAEGSNYG